MKKHLAAAILASMTLAVAAPAFANPFVDVPAKHWAYGSVSKLAAAGIVDGYGDGTFKGDKTITRYEMAQIVAKAMTKYDKASTANKAILDKLSKEFGKELKNLGVRVAALEKNQPNVKVAAETRFQYENVNPESGDADGSMLVRQRITLTGKVNEKVSGNIRLVFQNKDVQITPGTETFYADRIFYTVKDVAGLDWVIGRQMNMIGKGLLVKTGSDYYDALTAKVTKKDWSALVSTGEYNKSNNSYRAEAVVADVTVKLGTKADLSVAMFDNKDNDRTVYSVGTKIGLGKVGKKDALLVAEYGQNKDVANDPTAFFVQLTNGKAPVVFTSCVNSMVNRADKGDQAYALIYKSKEAGFNPDGANNFVGGADLKNDRKAIELIYQNTLLKNTQLTLFYTNTKVESTGAKDNSTAIARLEFFF